MASQGSSKRSTPSLLVYGGPLALVIVAVLGLLFVSRRREDEEPDPG